MKKVGYLIDGYNLFFRLAEVPNPLQTKRNSFILSLSQALVSAGLQATLVFDSAHIHSHIYPSSSIAYENLEILFSPRGLSADDYLLEYLEAHSSPHHLTLVTDDKRLSLFAKESGVKHLTIALFLARLNKRTQKKSFPSSESQKSFSESKREFERLLKIFEERLRDNR